MRVLITAGPTREYIDEVRFITNASSGKMGYACAACAVAAGHEVTLLTGPVALPAPDGCQVAGFVTIAELADAVEERFDACDALVMAAGVGDFTVAARPGKIPRSGGPVQVTLTPSRDILASVGARRRDDQVLVAFAVETGRDEQKARRELEAKNCDYVVLNPPAAMAGDASEACILSRSGVVLPWALRPKTELAREVVALLGRPRG